MKIDMHTHTRGSDGVSSAAEIAAAAVKAGLDGICLTDHHKTYTAESLEVAAACRGQGLRVFHGCEYSSLDGHVLVYGCNIEDLGLGSYAPMQAVLDAANAWGGVAIPSHPFAFGHNKYTLGTGVYRLRGLVALEGINGQCEVQMPKANGEARAAAVWMSLRMTGASDAHHARYVGCAYTEFDQDIRTDRDLVHALTYGTYRPRRVAEHVKSLGRLDRAGAGRYPLESAVAKFNRKYAPAARARQ